jgi:UDP-2,3-diacylglucosamine pyrophosphatase LpxH
MLVVVSDIHLSDGSTANNVHGSAFELLSSEILAAKGAKGATELHLLLLGDIFDLVRTDWWHRNTAPADRPWGGTLDPATGMNRDTDAVRGQFEQVFALTLAHPCTTAMLKVLNDLPDKVKLPVRITYVIGNHDRVLANFPSLQAMLRAALPNITQLEFATGFRSDRYGVLARHGHEWDENCHGFAYYNKVLRPKGAPELRRFDPAAYEVMAIGEVVTAELMSGLVYYARTANQKPDQEFLAFLEEFRDLNNLRPMLDVFLWVEWFARQRLTSYEAILHSAMKQALGGVLRSTVAKRWDAMESDLLVKGDLTDRLTFVYKHLLGSSFAGFRERVEGIRKVGNVVSLLSRESDPYLEGVKQEQEWESPAPSGIQYIMYGHTHQPRNVVISADLQGAIKLYVNTGTMLPLIEHTEDRKAFASLTQMTMVFVYGEDEDTKSRRGNGPTIDVWNGVRRKAYLPDQALTAPRGRG